MAVLSLLVCIASVCLWVRGHVLYDRCQWTGIEHGNKSWRWLIDNFDGEFLFAREVCNFDTNANAQRYARLHPHLPGFQHWASDLRLLGRTWTYNQSWFNRIGFNVRVVTFKPLGNSPSIAHSQSLCIPCWFAVIMTAAPVALWIYCFIKGRKRPQTGTCLGCGYDLRATRDRCPECGKAVE